MTRRTLLAALPLALGAKAYSDYEASRADREESPRGIAIGACHLGFQPQAGKRVIVSGPGRFDQLDIDLLLNGKLVRRLRGEVSSRTGIAANLVADFTDITVPGEYEIRYGNSDSVRFPIGDQVWGNVVPSLVAYQTAQRCGVRVVPKGKLCHLDDACRRDTGEHVDVEGGWHDAGDLRKWVETTILNLFGLLALAQSPASMPSPLTQGVMDEARYGNSFFLKMQDRDGLVWADVGGGVNGDNSDNRWTDNKPGTADDRWINVTKRPVVQAMFIAAEAMMSRVFQSGDPAYAKRCLDAATRCWAATNAKGSATLDWAWWGFAALELFRATGDEKFATSAAEIANRLSAAQVVNASGVSGYFGMWPGSGEPLRDARHSGLPATCLLLAARHFPQHADASRWRKAVRRYLDDYAVPMANQSEYRIVPFGLFRGKPEGNSYRPIENGLFYRFFMPVDSRSWLGLNSHLLSHALLFAEAATDFGDARYRSLTYAQLEWIFGKNPFSATLTTGLGYRNPEPYSRFAGPIRGES